MLADEQAAGRLRIRPGLVVLSAEGLPAGEYRRIAEAFGAKVRHGYAATECPFLSYSCPEGWLHVNTDWLTFEPGDADHRPLPLREPAPRHPGPGPGRRHPHLPTRDGEQVRLAPLVFGGLADRSPGIERFQLIQTTPTTVRLRLRPTAGADPEQVWKALHRQIEGLLADHGQGGVTVERADDPPEQTAGGKYRTAIPLA